MNSPRLRTAYSPLFAWEDCTFVNQFVTRSGVGHPDNFLEGACAGGCAVVESISGSSSGVEFMDYLHVGQVIRLSHHESLVLSYKASCLRETITGGTVTVGLDRSQVRSGEVQRSVGRCGEGKKLTDAQSVAGRTFRGGIPH